MKSMPKTLPGKIDRYRRTKEARLAKDREAAELKKEEVALREAILEQMAKEKLTAAGAKTLKVERVKKPIIKVIDWQSFYKHITATDGFHLMQRRTNSKSLLEAYEVDGVVPGTELDHVYTLSESKRS